MPALCNARPSARHAAVALLLALLCLLSGAARAQQHNVSGQQETAAVWKVAPVVIDGRKLFLLRGTTTHPARERAAKVRGRIIAAARDPRISGADITVVDLQTHAAIYAGDRLLVRFFEADADVEELDYSALAKAYRETIATAIDAYREEREPGVLARRAVLAALISLAIGFALFIALRSIDWLENRLTARLRDKLASFDEKTYKLISVGQLHIPVRPVLRLLRIAVLVTLGYFFLEAVLGLFPWTRPVATTLLELVLFPLQSMAMGLWEAIPNLAFLGVLYLIVRYLLKVTKAIFDGIAGDHIRLEGFEADWAMPTYRIIRILVIVCALVIAYPYIPGSDSLAFKSISVFAGILFSLGSSSFIANVIAGLMMTYRSVFKVGDRVRIGESVGVVEEIRLMVTRLHTSKNEVVVIPNSNILSTDVVNYSVYARRQGLIVHSVVGIGYDTPWRQVEALLLLAAARTEGLKEEPPPFVLQQSLGDFAVNYEINAYCTDTNGLPALYSRLHANIQDVFNQYGVQIMSPAYEADPATPKLVPPADWYAAPANPAPQTAKGAGADESQGGDGN